MDSHQLSDLALPQLVYCMHCNHLFLERNRDVPSIAKPHEIRVCEVDGEKAVADLRSVGMCANHYVQAVLRSVREQKK